jgi:RsiW-degrading membrane proteinase PrsW (M82 family)
MNWSLTALAIAPAVVIILYIYYHDKYEKEPLWKLAQLFLGGCFSTVLVLAASVVWQQLGFGFYRTLQETVFYAFVVVGGTEELAKFLILYLFAYRSRHFNEPFDGIMYATMVSMGFATVENIIYVFNESVYEQARWVALTRMFTAVPAHAAFAVLMGYFMGLAKFKKIAFPFLWLGLLAAVVFHGLYDFFLFIKNVPLISLGAFVSLYLGLRLSHKAIRLNQKASPFKYRRR